MKIINARVVKPGCIIENGTIITENGRIVYAGEEKNAPPSQAPVYDAKGLIAGPGFVDIHCHGGGEWWSYENPAGVGLYHLKGGTTSLLCSFWRNAVKDGIQKAIDRVKDAIENNNPGNIRGIHMEGPYLNPRYGTEGGKEYPVDPCQYLDWMDRGKDIIKYWTFDPEQEGTEEFARECQQRGIALGICYSDASVSTIEYYRSYGLNIGTHIMCATGRPFNPIKGTREPGSDEYVLVSDDMYAEVIADSPGAHIRPWNIKLIYKLKGAEKIIIITDCCTGGDTQGSDVNIIDGKLYGSRLTMNVACRNMKKFTSAGIEDIFKMASENPAKAVGIFDKYGSLEEGKAADIIFIDEDFNVRDVILGGKLIKM
ncbi:MAG TPA: amidohydrolase family protein [Clostridiaceae bacterium]|nr:amidohydrolase family protein [Clostridiaceae bacterium]